MKRDYFVASTALASPVITPFACLAKVWMPLMLTTTARMMSATAKMSWNQMVQSAPPAMTELILWVAVMTREVRVAIIMKTMGMKNILLLLPMLPSQQATAMRARPARSWLAAPNRAQMAVTLA